MEQRKSTISTEPVSRILSFVIPRLQRNLIQTHIDAMVEDQKQEYEKHGCFSMLQSITVASLDGKLYVLDGQHRIKAFQKLYEDGFPVHEVVLPIVVYHVKDKAELATYYQRINKNMPIHPFETEETWESVGKYVCERMESEFKAYIKACGGGAGGGGNSIKTCRCPHISMHELKTHMHARHIHERLRVCNMSAVDLWSCIKSLNAFVEKHVRAHTQLCAQSMKRIQECELKAEKNKCKVCYLGIWRRFEWLDIVLHCISQGCTNVAECHINLAEFSGESRRKIPFMTRELVWKKVHTNMCDEGMCYCCSAPLKFTDMECGHIIAHALGGKMHVDNLMPVCKSCNRDMGIMNLHEYKAAIANTVGGCAKDMMEC